ncbi:hypothetical protein BC937DRAFT_86268, partial [Endogone sp. FLAS-F59071]
MEKERIKRHSANTRLLQGRYGILVSGSSSGICFAHVPLFLCISFTFPSLASAPRDRNNVGPRFQRRAEDGSEPTPRSFRGAPGGSRGQRGGARGRGRQYDRHSATGIIDSEKKETQGWGDITTSQQEVEQVVVEE